jgi:hypothetical protein
MLENRVQTQNREISVAKKLMRALGLRRPMRHAAGAKHLEGVEHHDAPA